MSLKALINQTKKKKKEKKIHNNDCVMTCIYFNME